MFQHHTFKAVSGETVEFVNDDILKRAAFRVVQHLLKSLSFVRVFGRAFRFFGVNFDYVQAAALGELRTNADLPFYGHIVLTVRTVTGIYNCVCHCCLLLSARGAP